MHIICEKIWYLLNVNKACCDNFPTENIIVCLCRRQCLKTKKSYSRNSLLEETVTFGGKYKARISHCLDFLSYA